MMTSLKHAKLYPVTNLDKQMIVHSQKTRLDVQGLRAVAIIMVVVMHVWPTKYRNGYFGVDVFFVISGYLMCSFMRQHSKITVPVALSFYFRRVKRLVPTYLIVLLSTFFVSTLISNATHYWILFKDMFLAAIFFSNLPYFHRTTYALANAKSIIFLHSWSLSVEMQFYALVPPIFFCSYWLAKHWKLNGQVVTFSIAVISFFYQHFWLVQLEARYMLLASRLWQFALGFMGFDLRQYFEKSNKFTNLYKTLRQPLMQQLFQSFAAILLLISGSFSKMAADDDQLLRLLVSFLTFLVICLSYDNIQQKTLLTNKYITAIGDLSYSLYLVHFPILIAHQFAWMPLYKPYLPVSLGLTLIALFLLIACGLEVIGRFLNRIITGWRQLRNFSCIMYLLIGLNLLYLYSNAAIEKKQEFTRYEANKLLDEILIHQNSSLNGKQIAKYNYQLLGITEALKCPQVRDEEVFRDWPVDMGEEGSRVVQGNGTKTIVLFGNSHSEYATSSIERVFRDVYAEFITIFVHGCSPFLAEMQPIWTRVNYKLDCQTFIGHFPRYLQQRLKPDIVILLFGYSDTSPNGASLENSVYVDENFQFAQQFYQDVSKQAKELVIYSTVNAFFSETPETVVLKQADSRVNPLEFPSTSLSEQLDFKPGVRSRIDSIKCSPCVKFDPLQLWCNQSYGTFCTTLEENGLINFVDLQHLSAYGAIKNAQLIRRLYEQHTNQ
ncbi:Acyltransferase [Aphelenchoides bicaudatus]|nr:Acyltransferase [Aphelenchoides bicaudatus]